MANRSMATARKTMSPDAAAAETPARARPRAVDGSDVAADGPPTGARQTQAMLIARLSAPAQAAMGEIPMVDERWSARRTLGFAVLASAGLWALIGAGGYLILNG